MIIEELSPKFLKRDTIELILTTGKIQSIIKDCGIELSK
jgi:hypothetical protein